MDGGGGWLHLSGSGESVELAVRFTAKRAKSETRKRGNVTKIAELLQEHTWQKTIARDIIMTGNPETGLLSLVIPLPNPEE